MKRCLNCNKRYPACQDTCPDRAEELAEEEIRKEKIRKAKAKEKLNRDYVYEHYYNGRQM